MVTVRAFWRRDDRHKWPDLPEYSGYRDPSGPRDIIRPRATRNREYPSLSAGLRQIGPSPESASHPGDPPPTVIDASVTSRQQLHDDKRIDLNLK